MRFGSLLRSWCFILLGINLGVICTTANEETAPVQNEVRRKAELLAADRALEDFGQEANKVGRLNIELEALMEELNQLDSLQAELVAQTEELVVLARHVNGIQLWGLLRQLEELWQREYDRRQQKSEADNQITSIDLSNTVTKTELERSLNANEIILNETQTALDQWIVGIAHEIIEQRRREMVVPQNAVQCVKPSEAVHVVQSSLVEYLQDGTGKVDHAEGASIVYELTSNTYNPPPDRKELLGNVWWRRYIPFDWESLLPEGWKNWNVRLPAYLYHSLGWRGRIWSADAILDRDVLPGSCWPMEGTNGHVTLRLPNPVKIAAVTIDHASALLLPPEQRTSAPRRIRVVGFPPCQSTDCGGLGFQPNRRIPLIEFDYDIKGPSTQTFELEQSTSQASCSEEKKSCDGPGLDAGFPLTAIATERDEDIPFVAVTVEVLNNWGNKDYTCLYRFRVHGESFS